MKVDLLPRPEDDSTSTQPAYQEILKKLKEKYFLSPGGENIDQLLDLVRFAVETVLSQQGNGPIYPVNQGRSVLSTLASDSHIPEHMTDDPKDALAAIPVGMQGSVKASSPFMVKNIIPLPTLVHLATNLAVSLFMPNAVTGEDAGETLNAEIACAGAMANLAGLDPEKAAGIFTFGGTGTNLYAFKMGLHKALPNHQKEGLKGTAVIIGSKPAHYCHQAGADWVGIGQDNYIQAQSNLDQTTKLDDLEAKCREALQSGKFIACIEAVGGTTSNMAIDDLEAIYNMRNRLVEEFSLDYSPHIHADAVLGWVYLNFVDYDFDGNTLGFSKEALCRIKRTTERIKKIHFADSFGVDFHKTGYAPYISSMVMVKDKADFNRLLRDQKTMTPLFHDDSAYNPGMFTLETSRSAANILATWTSFKALGREGHQALVGHTVEISEHLKAHINACKQYGFCIANQEPFGCDIFLRCYPPGIDPDTTYRMELSDDDSLRNYTDYNNKFAKWLITNKSQGDEGIALSKSSAAFYTNTGKPMVALRIYPLNPYITAESAQILVDRLVKAKIEFESIE
ncbi:MAG: hypothetical protein ACD_15C00235G0004 [uncultured bacterium]|nr:MAG: hypothetical protein ACD_15C00235G0004 [uncultured bacterium]